MTKDNQTGIKADLVAPKSYFSVCYTPLHHLHNSFILTLILIRIVIVLLYLPTSDA